MRQIYILRHVESEANRAQVGLGRTDSPPTELGRRQIAATAEALADEPITRILSSPLQRARLLAEAIGAVRSVEVESRDELLELDVGKLEGLDWSITRERYGDFLRAWRGDEAAETPMPGGESLVDVLRRSRPLFDSLVDDPADGAALIVSHNFVVRMLLVHALDLPVRAWRRFDVGLAGLTTLRVQDGVPVVERLNDRHHLDALRGFALE